MPERDLIRFRLGEVHGRKHCTVVKPPYNLFARDVASLRVAQREMLRRHGRIAPVYEMHRPNCFESEAARMREGHKACVHEHGDPFANINGGSLQPAGTSCGSLSMRRDEDETTESDDNCPIITAAPPPILQADIGISDELAASILVDFSRQAHAHESRYLHTCAEDGSVRTYDRQTMATAAPPPRPEPSALAPVQIQTPSNDAANLLGVVPSIPESYFRSGSRDRNVNAGDQVYSSRNGLRRSPRSSGKTPTASAATGSTSEACTRGEPRTREPRSMSSSTTKGRSLRSSSSGETASAKLASTAASAALMMPPPPALPGGPRQRGVPSCLCSGGVCHMCDPGHRYSQREVARCGAVDYSIESTTPVSGAEALQERSASTPRSLPSLRSSSRAENGYMIRESECRGGIPEDPAEREQFFRNAEIISERHFHDYTYQKQQH